MGPVLRDDPSDPMLTAIRQVMGTHAARLILTGRAPSRRSEATRAAGGEPSDAYPFGLTRFRPDDCEQHVLGVIRDLRGVGSTLIDVAANLNNRPDHQPRHASRWTRQTVESVLR